MRELHRRAAQLGTVDPTVLAERVESLASWVRDLEGQLRASATIAQDPKTAKELAKALESWSKQGPKLDENVAGRIEQLAQRIAVVADTANATAGALAGRQGEIAALRRDLQQSTARLDAAVRQAAQSGASAELLELRHAVAALAAERQSRPRQPKLDVMPSKAEVLGERIDVLAKTVATTAAGLAGREGELASLRRSLDEAGARFDAVVGELRHSLDLVSAHVAGLDERTLDLVHTRELGSRVGELAASLDALTRRVDSIATGIDAAVVTLGDREREFAAVHRHFEETSSRIKAALGELEAGLAALPAPGTLDPAISARLDSFGRQLGTVTAHLAELEAMARATPTVQQALEAVDVRLARVGDRLEAIERDAADDRTRDAHDLLRDLERRLGLSEREAREGRDAVRTQLEHMAARVEWRLRRLESAVATTEADEVDLPLGQLLSIGGEGIADAGDG